MAYTLPQVDPSNPALPSPVFGDVSAARGDHLRANNNFIWQNFDALAALFNSDGSAITANRGRINTYTSGDFITIVSGLATTPGAGRYTLSFTSAVTNLPVEFTSGTVGVDATVISASSFLVRARKVGSLQEWYGVYISSTITWIMVKYSAGHATTLGMTSTTSATALDDIRSAMGTSDISERWASITSAVMPTSGAAYRTQFIGSQANCRARAFSPGTRDTWENVYTSSVWAGWVKVQDANGNPPSAAFDLIIDSDAKLATWAAGGSYSRVLIKAGTWTLASGGVDLTAAGTKEVIGEPGSLLVFSSVTTSALYYTSTPTTNDYRISCVSVSITSGSSGLKAFYQCINLYHCSVSIPSYGFTSSGFHSCSYLTGCISSVSAIGGIGYGFNLCKYAGGCQSTITTTTGTGFGFSNCSFLAECIATVTSSSNGPGFGFHTCDNIGVCVATVTTGGSPAAAAGYYQCTGVSCCKGTAAATSARGSGFDSCTQVTGCQGVGTGATGYGFYGCKKCVNNKAAGTSTTATYNTTSYADAGTAAACADTAAGGWNS